MTLYSLLYHLRIFPSPPVGAWCLVQQYLNSDVKNAVISDAFAFLDYQIILADETTKMIHGDECLEEIHQTVAQVFADGSSGSNAALPRYHNYEELCPFDVCR